MKDKKLFTLSDIFFNNYPYASIYSAYDMRFRQETNNLFYFPELYYHCEQGLKFEYSNNWSFARVLFGPNMSFKEVVKIIYNSFCECKNIAIDMKNLRSLEIRSSPLYIDEDFETLRNRCLYEVRDYLNIPHHGEAMMKSKHTGRYFKLE